MPAKKTTSRKKLVKRSLVKKISKKQTGWQKWTAEREQFYLDHPNIRVLLGIFLVVFVAYLVLMSL